MSATVTEKTDGLVLLKKRLAELKGLRVMVGFQGQKGATIYAEGKDPPNVATVAFWQEFGTIDIPARSFLRSTMLERRNDIVRAFAVELRPVFERGRDPVQALAAAGAKVAAMVKRKIDTSRHWAVPNAPRTIAKKGHDFQLHESDLMSESVTYTVRRGPLILAEGP